MVFFEVNYTVHSIVQISGFTPALFSQASQNLHRHAAPCIFSDSINLKSVVMFFGVGVLYCSGIARSLMIPGYSVGALGF